jgi:hypothetical protein
LRALTRVPGMAPSRVIDAHFEGGDIDIVLANASPETLMAFTSTLLLTLQIGATFTVGSVTETLLVGSLHVVGCASAVTVQVIHVPYHYSASVTIGSFDISVCKVAASITQHTTSDGHQFFEWTFTATPDTVTDILGTCSLQL